MRVRFWGTRGSIATPGPSTLRFGGNTSCVEVVTNAGQRFIFDAGTGVRPLGLELMASAPKPVRATILLGHTHWDHIQGFPFFTPVFVPGNEFTICAPAGMARSLADVLAGQMEFTYFPVELGQLPAKIHYRELAEGTYDFEGTRIVAQFINHPATSLGYRIEADGVVVAYICDHEPFGPAVWVEDAAARRIENILHAGDRRHAEFMRHADLLIHDAQYTPEEYPAKKNWGHSTFAYVVELAAAADVRQLALTHHEPTHDDAQLAEIEKRAQALAHSRNFSLHVFCAYEGCELAVAPPESTRSRTVDVADTALRVAPQRLRVLIVDDDPNMRLLVKAALGREGFALTEAEDGEQGLALIRSGGADLVLLDLNMPKVDGLTVLRNLRGQASSRDLPVVLLTAEGDEKTTALGFEAGATDYLAKPFTVPQLLARVRAVLSRIQKAHAARSD
jgi:CheY-like chemotaxis protein/phosphoribosyl 1,2-cyclic phosphodiesterase